MYKAHSVGVVIPCYNEATQIEAVLQTIPEYVDHVVVVDDCSKDETVSVVKAFTSSNATQIHLIEHEINEGVGGAIASGYCWMRDHSIDAAAVMAGDGQMNPEDLPHLLDPVVSGEADYSKGNRFVWSGAYDRIPRVRYIGNAILSFLTKIASGYWHVADSQTGYTVINKKALEVIDWQSMYKRYGQPNDLLVKLNVHSFRVKDVPVEPVYDVGEQSGINVRKVVFTIGWLLVKLFFWRLKEKYIIRDFHPLVLFYFMAFSLLIISACFLVRLIWLWIGTGSVPEITLLALIFCFSSSMQSAFFAMWFDSQYEER